MKLKRILLFSIVFVAGVTATGLCQPELVYVDKGEERRVDGIEGAVPYHVDGGEKKHFPEGGELFLDKNGSDLLLLGHVPVNYTVTGNEKGASKALVSITANSGEGAWNRISTASFFELWGEDVVKDAACFLCWYEPESNLLRAGDIRRIRYFDDKHVSLFLTVGIESADGNGFPIIFLWKENGPIPPKPIRPDGEDVLRSVISGETQMVEDGNTAGSLPGGGDLLGNEAIHYAAAFGRAAILEKLIAMGADVNAETGNGMTPLLLAVAAGHENVVSLLLQNGADAKFRDGDKRSALHYASYLGHGEIARELLKYSRDVNRKDAFSQSPVHYAINAENDSVIGLLADCKAKVQSDRENLQNALVAHISNENHNIVTFLLDQKARADEAIFGTTPLVVAAGNSDVEMVDLLIERGADVNRPSQNQVTPLLSACLTGRLEVVKYLLERDAKVDSKSASGLSALQAAVLRNDPEMIDLLVSYGVDIDEKDESGMTPFWHAAALGHRESMEKLLAVGATCNLDMKNAIGLMELAFRYDMPEAVRLALDQCLDADFLFYDTYPSTWIADYYGADEIKALLVASGARSSTGSELNMTAMKHLSEKPEPLEYTSIYYPLDLKRKYGSREFLVQIIIDEQGAVRFPKMVESEVPELERIVMETVTTWRFTSPRDASGRACATIAHLPIVLECEDIEQRTWELAEVDQVPTVLKSSPPQFPFELKRQNIQGRVVLRIIIDETGKPESIGIESMTHKGFAEAAIAAGKTYEFSPAYYQGKPVKVQVKLPISFTLR